MAVDLNKLIPELPLWNNSEGIDAEGWLSCMGSYELAVAYAEFFWPQFLEHDGCVFRGTVDEKNYQDWIEYTKGKKTSVEAVINHVHIVDIFPNAEKLPSKEQVLYLGRKLKAMWEAKLKQDFPDKKITVFFPEDERWSRFFEQLNRLR